MIMKTPVRFAKGDTVLHAKRPEWGHGKVRSIAALTGPDGSAQRLTVDFANRGRVVLSTAIAPLVHQASAPPQPKRTSPRLTPSEPLAATRTLATATVSSGDSGNSGSSGGWLTAMDGGPGERDLWDLPDALTDPFASLGDRLRATLQTCRYSTESRALMDWAIAQTGLDDPLSRYTRPELEHAFPRFARDRDQHLRDLVRQLKRKDDFATLKEVGRGLLPAAQSALDKAMRG